jgi:hypothetical protein
LDWSGNVHRIKGWGGRAKTKGLNTVIKTATHTKWGYRILNLYVVLDMEYGCALDNFVCASCISC